MTLQFLARWPGLTGRCTRPGYEGWEECAGFHMGMGTSYDHDKQSIVLLEIGHVVVLRAGVPAHLIVSDSNSLPWFDIAVVSATGQEVWRLRLEGVQTDGYTEPQGSSSGEYLRMQFERIAVTDPGSGESVSYVESRREASE